MAAPFSEGTRMPSPGAHAGMGAFCTGRCCGKANEGAIMSCPVSPARLLPVPSQGSPPAPGGGPEGLAGGGQEWVVTQWPQTKMVRGELGHEECTFRPQ